MRKGTGEGARGRRAGGRRQRPPDARAQSLTQYLSVLPSGSVSSPHLRAEPGGEGR